MMDALPPSATVPRAHVLSRFSFELAAPVARAAPMFTPEGERAWAGQHWDPNYLYPVPARDIEGAVFLQSAGDRTAVWVNTHLDLVAGQMQYVVFVPDAMVTTIDVILHERSPDMTEVEVSYARTALVAKADAHVLALGESDKSSGPKWRAQIAAALSR